MAFYGTGISTGSPAPNFHHELGRYPRCLPWCQGGLDELMRSGTIRRSPHQASPLSADLTTST